MITRNVNLQCSLSDLVSHVRYSLVEILYRMIDVYFDCPFLLPLIWVHSNGFLIFFLIINLKFSINMNHFTPTFLSTSQLSEGFPRKTTVLHRNVPQNELHNEKVCHDDHRFARKKCHNMLLWSIITIIV